MPLGATRRQKIRLYLGYPFIGRQLERTCENALNVFDTFEAPEAELYAVALAQVDEAIAQIEAVRASIVTALARAKYKRVEEIEYNVGGELAQLRTTGDLYVAQLSLLLGCPVRQNPFHPGMSDNRMRQG